MSWITPDDERRLDEVLIGGVCRAAALAELEQMISDKISAAIHNDRRHR